MQGTVVAVHSGGLYRVQCDAGHEVLAQLSGRMARFRIKVVPGDRVTVGVAPYDPVRGIFPFRARYPKDSLNSNPTHRRHPRRSSSGRPPGGRSRRGPQFHPARTAGPQAPALEPTPCDTTPVPFASFGLDPRLLEGIRDLGFTETRPIQTALIPLALAGDDLIGCAETGTGK